LAETERSVHNDHYESVEDFIAKMDSGELDHNFSGELTKLSKEQLKHLAQVLIERDANRRA